MHDTKPKTVFEERDELRRENERLKTNFETANSAIVLMGESLAESRKLAAELNGDIDELTFCEECGNDCAKMPENKCYPPRYCHTCQQILVGQLCEAKAQLAATEEALAQAQRESAELRDKYEAARKVADAAAAYFAGENDIHEGRKGYRMLFAAVREYTALSPAKQAAVDRALNKLDDIA